MKNTYTSFTLYKKRVTPIFGITRFRYCTCLVGKAYILSTHSNDDVTLDELAFW